MEEIQEMDEQAYGEEEAMMRTEYGDVRINGGWRVIPIASRR